MGEFVGGYGLVVGVSEYSDPTWNVPIASRDAQAVYDALTDPKAGGYPPNQVVRHLGAEASRTAVLKSLEQLAGRAGPESTVFISITSHGALNERELYTLATSDAEFVDGERIRNGTGLTITELAGALKTIRAERLLLVINACFAGYLSKLAQNGALREAPAGAVIPTKAGDTLLTSGKGRALITASRADQRSYFLPDDEQSVFGMALVDGLRGVGVSQRSVYVGLFELYTRIYQQAGRVAAMRGNPQEPVLSLLDTVGPFPVAMNNGASSPNDTEIEQKPPEGVRLVPQTVITAGEGGVAFQAAEGSNVAVDNRRYGGNAPVVDFGNAQIRGGVKMGDVVQGDLTKTVYNYGREPETARVDPIREITKIRDRISELNGLPDDLRDDAVGSLDKALKAAERGDSERARKLATEAAQYIDQMGHPTASSIARKLRGVLDALA